MNERISTRPATPADEELLAPLFLALRTFSWSHQPEPRSDLDALLAATRDYLRQVLARWDDPDARTLLALTEDGALAGYLVASIREPNPLTSVGPARTGAVEELYVGEEFRNGRIAWSLMQAVDDWFRGCRAEISEVGAYAWNAEAIAFYERLGYAPVGITLAKRLEPRPG